MHCVKLSWWRDFYKLFQQFSSKDISCGFIIIIVLSLLVVMKCQFAKTNVLTAFWILLNITFPSVEQEAHFGGKVFFFSLHFNETLHNKKNPSCIKKIVHPKIKIVIIYLASCCFKSV